MNTNKKIVLVTGGTSGIGLGTVEYLLESGNYSVFSVSRGTASIEKAKDKLHSEDVEFLQGDISNPEDAGRIYSIINEKCGRLDGLVNAAGIIKFGGIEDQSLEDWKKAIDINLTGVFILTKALLPLLKNGHNSSIVNVSSMASERPGGSIAYCASKAGLDSCTKYMAKELGKYNIRVNSINPGAVYTNIYVANGNYSQEDYDKWSEDKIVNYPLGRIGDAKKDLAPAIEFFLSEKSLWTTGSICMVDGGISI